MGDRYKIIYSGADSEITEKKSRFIATTRPVSSEEDAVAFVEEMKKKYWDARHNCYAYVIGDRNQKQKCSDDGEPSQTAGRPMLDVLLGEDIHNICVVVTRYFGGVLLGTGGLVRAYSQAVKEALAVSTVIERCTGVRLDVRTDYSNTGKIQYITGQMDIMELESEYSDTVRLTYMVPVEELQILKKKITEATCAKALMQENGIMAYGIINKKVILL